MSSSYNTEYELEQEASRLYHEAETLQEAAHILRAIRDDEERKARVGDLKKRAKEWMNR